MARVFGSFYYHLSIDSEIFAADGKLWRKKTRQATLGRVATELDQLWHLLEVFAKLQQGVSLDSKVAKVVCLLHGGDRHEASCKWKYWKPVENPSYNVRVVDKGFTFKLGPIVPEVVDTCP
jgi:hypothetical protein